jgi:hypothetical protein
MELYLATDDLHPYICDCDKRPFLALFQPIYWLLAEILFFHQELRLIFGNLLFLYIRYRILSESWAQKFQLLALEAILVHKLHQKRSQKDFPLAQCQFNHKCQRMDCF